MTQKQKVFAGVMTVVIVVVIGFAYRQFSMTSKVTTPAGLSVNQASDTVPVSSDMATTQPTPMKAVPATPDATVDAILDQSSLDDASLQNETTSEKASVTASGEDINNLTQTYDENQL